ncbi:MAG: hypothetical protein K2X35_16855 [Bryobacteraceae bacterium]|nr:hypothetical protein [Bryobacteraceae bacterium]
MQSEWSRPSGRLLWRAFSGIEAGIAGGLVMTALFVLNSLWHGRAWWTFPNLMGSTFFGDRSFRSGMSFDTVAGFALTLAIGGSLGALFGLAAGGSANRWRVQLYAVTLSLLWYLLSFEWIWPNINSWVPARAAQPAAAIGHLLFGLCLGRMRLPDPPPAPPPPEPEVVAAVEEQNSPAPPPSLPLE